MFVGVMLIAGCGTPYNGTYSGTQMVMLPQQLTQYGFQNTESSSVTLTFVANGQQVTGSMNAPNGVSAQFTGIETGSTLAISSATINSIRAVSALYPSTTTLTCQGAVFAGVLTSTNNQLTGTLTSNSGTQLPAMINGAVSGCPTSIQITATRTS